MIATHQIIEQWLEPLVADGGDYREAAVIERSAPEFVNGSSIDVRLGSSFMLEKAHKGFPPIKRLDLRQPLDMWEARDDVLLTPGAFVLAVTMERFNLPLNVSAEFRLKSSAGRMGLSHALAVWCDPGWSGHLTLELHNISRYHTIALSAGDRIGQMIFHMHDPVKPAKDYARTGAYNNDTGATPTKPQRS